MAASRSAHAPAAMIAAPSAFTASDRHRSATSEPVLSQNRKAPMQSRDNGRAKGLPPAASDPRYGLGVGLRGEWPGGRAVAKHENRHRW